MLTTPDCACVKRSVLRTCEPGASETCVGEAYVYPDCVGRFAVKEYVPLEVPPTFAISNETAVMPLWSVEIEVMRTERSAGETGTEVGAGVGVGAGAGAGTGSGVGITGTCPGTTVVFADPCAAPACPELVEVEALGMKMMERGTESAEEPLRDGVRESSFFSPGTVNAAPHGMPMLPVWKRRPLLH
jgi:hypothetical protein